MKYKTSVTVATNEIEKLMFSSVMTSPMEFDHRQVLSLLEELMKPLSTVKGESSYPRESMFTHRSISVINPDDEQEQLLTINLIFSNACERFTQANTSSDFSRPSDQNRPVYYRYVDIHLHLLDRLFTYESQQLSSSHLPLFSIQDEAILSRSLSFVVLLGLILHFDEGIYLSLEKYLQNSQTSLHLLKLKADLSHHHRMFYLNETLTRLNQWIRNSHANSFVTQCLSSQYLLECILSHLQLLYSPNCKYSSTSRSETELEEHLQYLRKQFASAFIQQLMLLNRLLSTTVNSPAWLRQRCGDLLTSILIDEDQQGVRRILQTVLDSSAVNDRLYTSLAQILSTCPKQLPPEAYLSCIQSQLLELMHDPRYMPIVRIAINQLYRKSPKLIEETLFAVLFQVLLSCRERTSTGIASEEQWESFLDDLHQLTDAVSNEAIRVYLQENHLNELINLYLAIDKSLVPSKGKYLHVLINLLSAIDQDKAVQCFEQILFRMEFVPLKFLPDQTSNFALIVDSNQDNDLEHFAQSISQLLFAIRNNERLVIRIFLHLLQLLITKNDTSQSAIWTENERKSSLQHFLVMEVLKRILEYLTDHIDIIINNVDDTICVLQVTECLLEEIHWRNKQQRVMNRATSSPSESQHSISVLPIISLAKRECFALCLSVSVVCVLDHVRKAHANVSRGSSPDDEP